MSIALAKKPAEAKPPVPRLYVPTRIEATPLYVVCSPLRGVGKTLLSRLLIEFHELEGRPVTAFDLADEGPQLADFIPARTAIVNINDIFGQMSFFDSLISDNSTIQLIDLGHQNFRDFFILAQKIGVFEEARRRAIEPLFLFMADSDPRSAKAYSILQRWFADVLLLPVRNRAVAQGAFNPDRFPHRGAVSISPEIPALAAPLQTLVEQKSFSFARFWRRAFERSPARENELLPWIEHVFHQFRQIENSIDAGAPGKREAGGRIARENGEAEMRIAQLQEALTRAEEKTEQWRAEASARAEQIVRLQGELGHARRIAQEGSVEADARIEQIRKETDDRILRVETDTEKRLARAHEEIEGTFARLEAELAVAKQRAERAEYWLSRIRRQIEGHLIPSFTAAPDVRAERLYRKGLVQK